MVLQAGARLGPYEIVAPLGAGGMGEVYRARDARLGRDVALKVLPVEVASDSSRLKRFEKEARAASALNHPNIVTIYEIGSSDSISYIAMEVVEGKSLRELLLSGPLAVKRLLQIGTQMADGLARAHEAGIVHRDLKPENVMVAKDGLVKILDFGLAKLTQADSSSGEASHLPTETGTSPGTILGTVGYMSPEQASGQPLDFRSDQFSFGSILYEMSAGKRAFQRKTPVETLSAILREEPDPLAESAREQVPLPLTWIVERCLAKNPEERYASTRDLARDLASMRDRLSLISGGPKALLASPEAARRRIQLLPVVVAILALGLAVGAIGARNLWRSAAASAPSFHRLTFRRGPIENARFAPDGQTIVYGAHWDNEPPGLYSTRPESPESRPFDFGPRVNADILSISRTGEMAVLLDESGPRPILARVPLAGGAPREVVENVPYASADWAPDGKDLVIVRAGPGRSRLEYPIGRVLLESGTDMMAPRFSPRGDLIAFLEGAPPTSVRSIETSGKGARTLSTGWVELSGAPCWRPDGKEVWLTAKRSGETSALYAVDLLGKVRLVTRVPGDLELEDISRDGRVLAAHHTMLTVVLGVAPGEEKEHDLSWLDNSMPVDLSSDGRTLLLTEIGEGSGAYPAVYLRKTDGSPPVRLGEGIARALSPDGSWVVGWIGEEKKGKGERERLLLLPTGPGQARSLPDSFEDVGGVAWFPDGKRIIFSAQEKGHESRLYVQEVPEGRPRPISPEPVFMRQVTKSLSPDGTLVMAVDASGRTLLYPISGGEPRAIPGLQPGDRPLGWASDGRSVYVHRPQEVPNKVWLLDLAIGAKRLWKEIQPAERVSSIFRLYVNPAGSAYVYRAQRFFSELYLVEGLR